MMGLGKETRPPASSLGPLVFELHTGNLRLPHSEGAQTSPMKCPHGEILGQRRETQLAATGYASL